MSSEAQRHTLLEDVQGFLSGTLLCAICVLVFSHLGLIAAQTAGLALLLSYLSGWSFGLVFFLVNLPFYIFSYLRMGARFTVKTFVAVAVLSVMTVLIPPNFVIARIDTLTGALIGGAMAGFGLVILFRHGASLGGVGIVGLYIQDKTGFRAGWVQLLFDAALFGAAVLVLEPVLVAYSLLGAVVTNVSIALNHRKDRYIVQ